MTCFEEKVWRACAKIPRGEVSTYKLIAKAIGKPKSARAVGNALNKNKNLKKVPCYRVVKSDGSVGGYARGQKKKIKMLIADGIKIKNKKIQNLGLFLFRF